MRVLGVDPGAVSGAYALLGEHPKETHVGDVPVVDRQVNAAEPRKGRGVFEHESELFSAQFVGLGE